MSWTAVYWFLWGLTQPLYCVKCREVFLAGDIGGCHSHPQQEEACFPRGPGEQSQEGRGGDGYYPCCKKMAYRFALEPSPLGCVTADHSIREEDEDPQVLRALRLQRHNITYQDWRVAMREEVGAAVKSAAATSGGDGDGLGGRSMGDGAGGWGLQGVSSGGGGGGSRLGEGDPGGGGGGGGREKALAKLAKTQPSSGSRRPPRGPDAPPAVVTTTTITTTTTIDAVSSSPRCSGGSSSSGGGSTNRTTSTPPPPSLSSSSSSSAVASVGKRPASASSIGRRSAKTGSGGRGGGVTGGRGGDNSAAAVKAVEAKGRPSSEEGVLGGAQEGTRPEGPPVNGRGNSTPAPVPPPPTPGVTVAVKHNPAAAGGPAGSSGDCRRIWEFHASERLSARERGLLPNEHPVQQAPLQQRCANGDPFTTSAPTRRWQADGLRESDGLRMAQLCDELRRKRRGGAQQQQQQQQLQQ